MTPEEYDGTEQYARAKGAQITLDEMWAGRYRDRDITFHALHPAGPTHPGSTPGSPPSPR